MTTRTQIQTHPLKKENTRLKKHITNDGIVDAKAINMIGPAIRLKGAQPQNTPLTTLTPTTNAIKNNQNSQNNQNQGQPCQTKQFPKRCTHTTLGEPIEVILKKLLQNDVNTLQDPKPYDPGQFKPSWWDNNAFFITTKKKGIKLPPIDN